MPDDLPKYKLIVIGSSAGGMRANQILLENLPSGLPVPIVIAQHVSADSDNYLVEYLDRHSPLQVVEAREKVKLQPGFVYIAPPDYHVLVENDLSLSLSVDYKVNYARPSIDVLFESAALAFGKSVLGILLTGANHDGGAGMHLIHRMGGYTIVQNPKTAEVNTMPLSALHLFKADAVLDIEEIPVLLRRLVSGS